MPAATVKLIRDQLVINFRNVGDSEWNDVIYERVFSLESKEHKFILQPHTDFWRFGLRLHQTKEIPFSTSSRHINEGNIDIQLAVGTWYKPDNYWENANRIELGHYNLGDIDHVIDRYESYITKTNVEFTIQRIVNDQVKLTYKCGTYDFSRIIQISPGYRFFKIFAWADKRDFNLDCIPYPQNEFQSIDTFTLGKITFRKTDLFNSSILEDSDLIILPCSKSGSAQPNITSTAEKLGIPLPIPAEAGELEVVELNNDLRPKFWGWAYSVDEESSSASIISKIINKIFSKQILAEVQTISLPLLGTGAGGLRIRDVADLYRDIIDKTNAGKNVIVAINNNQWFEDLVQYYQSDIRLELEVIAANSNKFLYKDKVGIDPVLNVSDVAAELANVVFGIPENENEGMIGIFGKWGRGKTFLMTETWKEIQKIPNVLRVDFHTWKYQDTPAVWGYLFEQFAETFYSSIKGRVKRFWYSIKLNIYRIGLWPLIYFFIGLSLSLYWVISISSWEKWSFIWHLITSLGFSVVIGLIFIYYRYGKTAKSLFRDYTQRISFIELLGIQAEIQKELKLLIRTWSKAYKWEKKLFGETKVEKIILFVEDIDRCSESKIVEIIDALRVMLEEKEISNRVTVIAAIDEVILRRAIVYKYSKFIDSKDELDLITNEYIDKLFIIGLRLGQLSQREKDEYFIELTKDQRAKFDVEPFNLDEIIRPKRSAQIDERNTKKELQQPIASSQVESNLSSNGDDASNTITSASANNKFENIQKGEFEILRKGLLEHDSLTPRQIRVFYYRYIIAKNLLERAYAKSKRENIWTRTFFCTLLVKLLVQFSKDDGREKLDKHRMDVLHNTAATQRAYSLDSNINTLDYRELLKVLDIVIAY